MHAALIVWQIESDTSKAHLVTCLSWAVRATRDPLHSLGSNFRLSVHCDGKNASWLHGACWTDSVVLHGFSDFRQLYFFVGAQSSLFRRQWLLFPQRVSSSFISSTKDSAESIRSHSYSSATMTTCFVESGMWSRIVASCHAQPCVTWTRKCVIPCARETSRLLYILGLWKQGSVTFRPRGVSLYNDFESKKTSRLPNAETEERKIETATCNVIDKRGIYFNVTGLAVRPELGYAHVKVDSNIPAWMD